MKSFNKQRQCEAGEFKAFAMRFNVHTSPAITHIALLTFSQTRVSTLYKLDGGSRTSRRVGVPVEMKQSEPAPLNIILMMPLSGQA